MFKVRVVGDPSASIMGSLPLQYFNNQDGKTLTYTNSKYNAEESITKLSESDLSVLGIDGDVIALTGDSGVMMKVLLIDAFCGDFDSNMTVFVADGAFDENELEELWIWSQWPNLCIMPVTSAVSS